MFDTIDRVFSYIKEKNIIFIDLKFSDLFGGWHHITLPAPRFDQLTLEEGIGFDASSMAGFKSLEAGDMVLLPDIYTGFNDPFFNYPTLSFICNIAEADSRKRFGRDPRFIAQQSEDFLRSTGIATESKWGPEFEYYIFNKVDFRNDSFYTYFKIDSEEAEWANYQNESNQSGYQIAHHKGYHAIPPFDVLNNIRTETVHVLESCGVPIKYHHHEVGSSGQVEIEVVLGSLTRMGDIAMLTKYIAKNVAKKFGKTATFMPKPLYQEAGSGMHFHQHLFKNGLPLFYDKSGYGGLSQLALSYTAGILKHAPALTGLTNPSTNSFRRLVPGYEAPVSLFFSLANRSSAVRIPKYTTNPMEKRIEFRPPDATCNPYIAMSAMLLAGIDGIQNKLDIRQEGFGPFDVNLFAKENGHVREKITSIPTSLENALDCLNRDNDFLTRNAIFPPDLISTWIQEKMNKDLLEDRNRPTPYEFLLYYGV
ncbi:MAG: type I glutamate--ammonia ligase [Candidatus Marinimicrobia bacterium]|nr:type I glutamate--ammonia ligase [Candidatus Neomarinimicrobiota bacterium]